MRAASGLMVWLRGARALRAVARRGVAEVGADDADQVVLDLAVGRGAGGCEAAGAWSSGSGRRSGPATAPAGTPGVSTVGAPVGTVRLVAICSPAESPKMPLRFQSTQASRTQAVGPPAVTDEVTPCRPARTDR